MLFFYPYKIFLFDFSCFPNIIIYILNIARAIKKISGNEIRDFIFENYYKQIGFSKENSYYSMQHQKKIFTIVCN